MIALSYSGGKDSNAMLLLAIEKELDFIAVYNDTGFEHSSHYEYIDYVRRETGANIIINKSSKYDGMIDLIEKRKALPSGLMRFCSSELKLEPMGEFLVKNPHINENWVGVRTAESTARANRYQGMSYDDLYPMNEVTPLSKKKVGHVNVRFPIVDWPDSAVWDIHKRHKLKRNPQYDVGAKRVGCFPCVLSTDRAWYLAWQTEEGKANIRKLRELEKMVNENQVATGKAKPGESHLTFRRNYVTIDEMILRMEDMDAQEDMFDCNNDLSCGFCKA